MNRTPIVVMGMGPSGLFLVRQLHHFYANIYAIGRKDDVGMYSKYILKAKRCYAISEEAVYATLKEIKEKESIKPRVYLCSDQYLTMLVNSVKDWESVCEIVGAGLEVLAEINNKEQINNYCLEKGILIPKTEGLISFRNSDNKIFPIIIKWKEKELEISANPIGKTFVCETEEMFESLMDELEKTSIKPETLLVQSYIRGNNNYQYSVGGYYKDGSPLALVAVKQAMQYPQGISAQVYTVHDEISEKVETIARGIAERLTFEGFLETEFKIDEVTGEIYLLDVNPRPWGWISILAAVYEDFYKVLINEAPKSAKRDAIWTSPIRKRLAGLNNNNVEIDKSALNYNRAKDIADNDDKKPSIMIFIIALKKKLKRR